MLGTRSTQKSKYTKEILNYLVNIWCYHDVSNIVVHRPKKERKVSKCKILFGNDGSSNGSSNEQLAIMFNSHVLVNKLPQFVYAQCTLSSLCTIVPCMVYGCVEDNYSRSTTPFPGNNLIILLFEFTITPPAFN